MFGVGEVNAVAVMAPEYGAVAQVGARCEISVPLTLVGNHQGLCPQSGRHSEQ